MITIPTFWGIYDIYKPHSIHICHQDVSTNNKS